MCKSLAETSLGTLGVQFQLEVDTYIYNIIIIIIIIIIINTYVHNICNIGWKWCVPKIIPYCMVETSSKPPWTIRFPVPPMTSQRALLLAPSAELTTPPCSCQWLTQCFLQDLNDVQSNVGSFCWSILGMFLGLFWGCFGEYVDGFGGEPMTCSLFLGCWSPKYPQKVPATSSSIMQSP